MHGLFLFPVYTHIHQCPTPTPNQHIQPWVACLLWWVVLHWPIIIRKCLQFTSRLILCCSFCKPGWLRFAAIWLGLAPPWQQNILFWVGPRSWVPTFSISSRSCSICPVPVLREKGSSWAHHQAPWAEKMLVSHFLWKSGSRNERKFSSNL